ncbi:CHASE3 domain-containing protein [Brevundimonas sp.]|uniref:sensor histidine kinase n=1 Tax=Brevundimonas sp. TaxID=1871086 RepID=UPI0035B0788A
MSSSWRHTLQALGHFVRTPTLGRRVAGLLALAIALLLAINVAAFVMIRRTAGFNDMSEHAQRVRLAADTVLIRLLDAESGQRGYMLTARQEYLAHYDEALRVLPQLFDELETLTADDPDLAPRVARLREVATARVDLAERTVALARMGRVGEAVSLVRSGQGRARMDELRVEVEAINEILATQLQFRTRQTEWANGLTLVINAIGALLIIALAGVSAWLIRRYVLEVQQARDAIAALNASLETKVRDRTADLTRANEEIQRFAYIVSHDLRAPLVNVMGYTSELEQANKVLDRQVAAIEQRAPKTLDADAVLAVREDVPEAIGFIRASTEKMDRLINAILRLSREGRRALVVESLDMGRMVENIAASVRHQTEAASAEIVVEPLPWLESDRLSVEQIFGNLIDNAIKYLDPARPGRIVVSGSEEPGGQVVYRVVDNGRGISDRDHDRIFELFRRSGRQDRPGEGLGLAFVRNSVRRLGGEISVESELGRGSTFTLKFPKRLNLADAGDHA